MPDQRLILRTLIDLAGPRATGSDTTDLLYLLCDRAVHILDVDAAGVLRMGATGRLHAAASSSDGMHRLLTAEAGEQQGPGVHAHHHHECVDVLDLQVDDGRWPAVASAALAHGFRSMHVRPLALRAEHVGAVCFASARAGPLAKEQAEVAGALAHMAAVGVAHVRELGAAGERIRQLQHALDSRIVVEQACAVLADREGLDIGEASGRLRRYARDHNERLRRIARRFLDGHLDTADLRTGHPV